MVQKLASSNPQKLRQIGLNYDIANAKGTFEADKEAAELKEKKAKATKEKKKRDDLETFKKETTDELQVWKREIEERLNKQESADSKEKPKDGETLVEHSSVIKADAAEDLGQKKDASVSSSSIDKPENSDATADSTAEPSAATTEPATQDAPATKAHTPESNKTKGDDDATATTTTTTTTGDNKASTAQSHGPQAASDEPTPVKPAPKPTPAKEEAKPWNAVCVLGLRVYSLDPEVTIKLVKPKDAEEAAILDVDGDTAAGATM